MELGSTLFAIFKRRFARNSSSTLKVMIFLTLVLGKHFKCSGGRNYLKDEWTNIDL